MFLQRVRVRPNPVSGSEQFRGSAWLTTVLLFLFMVINFADKAVLGLAAQPIMRELGLSHAQFGSIGASFFGLFSLSALCAGFLVDRMGAKWVILAMVLTWSLCQAPMLIAAGIPALVANRVVLGLAEGPAYPVALHAAYRWFPDRRRPVPTSLIAIGGAVGTGVVAPVIQFLILTWSWRIAFSALGAVGLLWCAGWMRIAREEPVPGETIAIAGGVDRPAWTARYRQLLTSRTFIGCVLIGFAGYWAVTVAVVWLPAFLERALGFSPAQAARIVVLPPLCQMAFMPITCKASEFLRESGVSSRSSRGFVAGASLLLAGLAMMLLAHVEGRILPVLCTMLAFSVGNLIFCLTPVMISEITPLRQRGSMLGINTATITLAGPLAPLIVGLIIDAGTTAASGFRTAFALTGVCVSLSAIIGLLLINPEADLRRLMPQFEQRSRDSKGPSFTN